MVRIGGSYWARSVAVLCALALILLSSAHRPVAANPTAIDPAVAAYLSVGGSLADLCLAGGMKDGTSGHADCPACTLAKVMAAGPCADGPARPAALAAEFLPPPAQLLLAGAGPRAPPARGPPSIQLI
jgi:hypothetical protein